MVPGHEIIGTVTQVGSAVETFNIGERAGIGCLIGQGGCAISVRHRSCVAEVAIGAVGKKWLGD
jgi:D-arabinose 1-dehydrogenase-like Zn-dependent alcohol dehydrogenase